MAAEVVPQESPGKGASNMRSLERAMDVLDALARHEGPVRLSDIARATGLHRATALRILTTLQKRDYVTSDAGVTGSASRFSPPRTPFSFPTASVGPPPRSCRSLR
ncbi:helix-turn-helix domain-containing protein [Micromonospora pallida]|uniref:helix-turn-helix domain-containing protein n=1 Tax=Micromonospora pallida TaxID=145854 RepID=UPI000B889A4B